MTLRVGYGLEDTVDHPAERQVQALAPALVDLAHLVLHLFTEAGRTYDLTQQQAELVCAVVVRGKVRMNELGKLMHLEKSNLSGLMDRAERRGIAVRTRDPQDRRASWVELTDEGMRLAMQTHTDVTARLDRLLKDLSGEDQTRLADVVKQIVADDEL